MKRIIGVLALALVLVFGSIPIMASDAGEATDYQYTVRLSSGLKGTFSDGSTEKVFTFNSGEYVNLSELASAVPTDDRYNWIGYRQGGRDNDSVSMPVFQVTKDIDYVAAYGLRGVPVDYTLRFVEYGTGRQLASPVTLSGSVGDKPIEGYQYIEGYRPLYRNITKTLSENAADNVFTFEYASLTRTVETTTTETVTVPGTTTTSGRGTTGTGTTRTGTTHTGGTGTVGTGGTGTAGTGGTGTAGTGTGGTGTVGSGGAGTAGTGTAGTGGTGTAGTEGTGGTGIADTEGTGGTGGTGIADTEGTGGIGGTGTVEPPETQDIRDDDVPIANPDGSSADSTDNVKTQEAPDYLPWIIGVIIAAAAAIAIIFGAMRRKRNNK